MQGLQVDKQILAFHILLLIERPNLAAALHHEQPSVERDHFKALINDQLLKDLLDDVRLRWIRRPMDSGLCPWLAHGRFGREG